MTTKLTKMLISAALLAAGLYIVWEPNPDNPYLMLLGVLLAFTAGRVSAGYSWKLHPTRDTGKLTGTI
jgi:threonine/homoserine efflux transporter RhtA